MACLCNDEKRLLYLIKLENCSILLFQVDSGSLQSGQENMNGIHIVWNDAERIGSTGNLLPQSCLEGVREGTSKKVTHLEVHLKFLSRNACIVKKDL